MVNNSKNNSSSKSQIPLHTFVVLAYKESPYLENCIHSVLDQTTHTNVVLATSTPNKYIKDIAKKYNLKIYTNPEQKGIGYDFDFATNCVKSTLVTVAHQDDIYDPDYATQVIGAYQKYPSSTIIFTDYYEIKNNQKETSNLNLKLKRVLLSPLRIRPLSKLGFTKRSALRFGCAICCPAVTFVTKNVPKDKFKCNLKCNIDWFAWEKISRLPGNFIHIPQKLMGHRIHQASTTTEIIHDNIRTKEDLIMFQKFWPIPIAKALTKFYKKSENNNNLS